MKRFAVIAAITLTIIGVGATAANASSCTAGRFCTFWDSTGGAMYYYTPRAGCIEIGAPWDDNISSYNNQSTYTVIVYVNHGCSGVFKQGIAPRDYLIEGLSFNDTASSFYFVGA